jgi:hypothetical protein
VSNASTIRRQVGGSQQLTIAPLLGTTITTTATPFSLNNNALTLSGGGIIPLSAGVTGLYAGTGQVIQIHAAGVATGLTTSSSTLLFTLYQVPASALPLASTVVTSANLVTAGATAIFAATVSGAIAGTQGSFSMDVFVQLDGQSNLYGHGSANVLNTITADKIITPVLTTGEADLNFVLGVAIGTTEAGVIVNLDEFSLSLV